MQHFLNFFPEPQGHRSFGPIFAHQLKQAFCALRLEIPAPASAEP
jgi:hypothetical protein